MKPASNCYIVESLHWFYDSTIRQFNGLTIFVCALLLPLAALAQFSSSETSSARSVSGQFVITGGSQASPLANQPAVADNPDFVRLEPPLLAVSAERIKESLWRQLGINANTPWRGQISIALHPAQSLDENVTVISMPFASGCNYRVELPDILSRTRFTRALTGVILLEFANRDSGPHPVEIPAWLIDGLSQQLLAAGSPEIILSSPNKILNGLSVTRIDKNERGLDLLAAARRALRNYPALTFEQLSWPAGSQLSGDDDGDYRASAQLFVNELLGLKNGAAKLRTMLETLPQFYNWQSAFQKAFRADFPQPLDVEKWWALQIVNFVARDPGPQWTPTVSREKLAQILSVPVEMRATSNNLPTRAEISLQAVIRNLDSAQQSAILQAKLRDLELAQLRMAPQLAVLTDAYRRAIADYLGQHNGTAPAAHWGQTYLDHSSKISARDTLKKLDALDAQRRTIEETIKPDIFAPRNLEHGRV